MNARELQDLPPPTANSSTSGLGSSPGTTIAAPDARTGPVALETATPILKETDSGLAHETSVPSANTCCHPPENAAVCVQLVAGACGKQAAQDMQMRNTAGGGEEPESAPLLEQSPAPEHPREPHAPDGFSFSFFIIIFLCILTFSLFHSFSSVSVMLFCCFHTKVFHSDFLNFS